MFKNRTAIAILLVLLVLTVGCNLPTSKPAPVLSADRGEAASPAGQAAQPTQNSSIGYLLSPTDGQRRQLQQRTRLRLRALLVAESPTGRLDNQPREIIRR